MGRWKDTTKRLRAKADGLYKVSAARKRRLVSLAEALAVKGGGRFTKAGFEWAYREKHMAARLPGYGVGLTRRVLFDAGYQDDFSQEESTYCPAAKTV